MMLNSIFEMAEHDQAKHNNITKQWQKYMNTIITNGRTWRQHKHNNTTQQWQNYNEIKIQNCRT